ncbi:MAG: hypothetical protein WBW99_04620 [Pseudolabrys sp.]|jgi:hypothetical protein
MRKLVGIALVLGATFVSVMAVPDNPRTEMVTNNQIHRGMTGLKVSLPSDLKNFPVEIVPLD